MELVNGNQVADLRLMQMFPWFGVLRYGKDEMSLMAKAKFELFRDAKLQVYYDVQRTWYELYKVQKDISISEKNIDILKLIERLALVRFKSASLESTGSSSQSAAASSVSSNSNSTGSSVMQTMGTGQGNTAPSGSNQSASMQTGTMGSSSGSSGLADIYRIQIESSDLENNIALLKNQQNSITAKFNTYLNRPVTSLVYTYENITMDSLEFSLTAVSDSMLARNPMLGMLDFEKQSLEARKKMVTRMGYPMVGLGLNYSLIRKIKCRYGRTIHEWKGYDNANGSSYFTCIQKKIYCNAKRSRTTERSRFRKLPGHCEFIAVRVLSGCYVVSGCTAQSKTI